MQVRQYPSLSPLGVLRTNMWMSECSYTSMHYATYENILLQLQGTKYVTIFQPSDEHSVASSLAHSCIFLRLKLAHSSL